MNKDPFTKNIALMTYLIVLGAEFPCRIIFHSFCSNWFKLVSAQPPNSQTFRKNKDIDITIIKIFGPNISSSFNMMMSTALKDTLR